MVANSGKSIGVIDCDIICEYKKQIENPVPILEATNIPSNLIPFSINPQDIRKQYISMESERALTESQSKNIKM